MSIAFKWVSPGSQSQLLINLLVGGEGSLGLCPNPVFPIPGRLQLLSPLGVLLDFRKGELSGSQELLQAEGGKAEDHEPDDDVDASSEGKGRKLKKKVSRESKGPSLQKAHHPGRELSLLTVSWFSF